MNDTNPEDRARDMRYARALRYELACQRIARVVVEEDCDRLRKAVDEAAEHLRWCSGSADFQAGGQAREGWLRGPGAWLERFERAKAMEEDTTK
jgi:hypothetical protein